MSPSRPNRHAEQEHHGKSKPSQGAPGSAGNGQVAQRFFARAAALFVLSSAVLTGFAGVPSLANAATAETPYTTNPADCAVVDPSAHVGACIALPGGGQTWLGSYRDPVDGRIFICIDYLYNSQLASYSTGSASGLVNKTGAPVPDTSVRALSYVDSKYAPAGSSGDPITDAALGYIARVVMGDGYVSNTAAPVSAVLPDTPWGLPAAIYTRARQLWDEARTHFGPYTLTLAGLPATGVAGRTYTATATLLSSAQAVGGAHPMAGVAIGAATIGQLRVTSGNGALTNSAGQTTVKVRATARGTGTLTATAGNLPGTYANVEIPAGWRTNAPDDTVAQRGLIATASAAAAKATETITHINPAVPWHRRPAVPPKRTLRHHAGTQVDPDGDGGGPHDTDDLRPIARGRGAIARGRSTWRPMPGRLVSRAHRGSFAPPGRRSGTRRHRAWLPLWVSRTPQMAGLWDDAPCHGNRVEFGVSCSSTALSGASGGLNSARSIAKGLKGGRHAAGGLRSAFSKSAAFIDDHPWAKWGLRLGGALLAIGAGLLTYASDRRSHRSRRRSAAHSIGVTLGSIAGASVGSVVGGAIGGPVGAAVGGVVGAAAGGVIGGWAGNRLSDLFGW